MSFPTGDKYWVDAAKFVQNTFAKNLATILAPEEFEKEIAGRILPYSLVQQDSFADYDCLIIHKGRIKDVDYSILDKIGSTYFPMYANEVFVVLCKENAAPRLSKDFIHLQSFYKNLKLLRKEIRNAAFKNLAKSFFRIIKRLHRKQAAETSVLVNKRTTHNKQPNLTFINQRILFSSDVVRSNVKALGYQYARSLLEKLTVPDNLSPQKVGLGSKACKQQDIESVWFAYWCQELKVPIVYHRKLWEFCYILQVMYEHDMLKPSLKGLGFGCGEEPLPSLFAAYDIEITATDIDPQESVAKGWVDTNQSATSLEKIRHPDLCGEELFKKNVSLKYVDMNNIPDNLENKYDFCWSACALEHLGSIDNGLRFIEKSLKTLVPGGLSIHTTEFNFLEEEETIDNWGTVLFRKRDFIELAERLTSQGHQVVPLDFDIGSGFLDQFIDIPPYQQVQDAHLKLLVDGFATTSFGMIVIKRP